MIVALDVADHTQRTNPERVEDRGDGLLLRAAIHAGEVVEAEWGVLGDALDETFRLLASPQLRTAQALGRTDLAAGGHRRVLPRSGPGGCARLARFNATAATAARMRPRFVLSSGEPRRDEYDYFGNALNEACWLLDSQVLRDCLDDSPDDSPADAVLMVSTSMYENVIRHGYGDIDPAGYRPHTVPLKTGAVLTWVLWDAAVRPGTPRPR